KQVVAGEASLERARVAVDECVLKAPSDGTIQLLPYELGELVPPGVTLASMVDISVAKAAFYLPNADLAAASLGGSAQVYADAWPDRVFVGSISTIATQPEFTPRNIQTRTDRDLLVYRVEVSVDNADSALRPGMPVVVKLLGDKQ
ncbi:MAG: HlyD family efflux transporter periplasmic adaptor subunit, partial [Oligoflexia bacterium]|nr:HlyD family efflux transporter periplasmic adaptor subunit [Oligoflexia bacterium]